MTYQYGALFRIMVLAFAALIACRLAGLSFDDSQPIIVLFGCGGLLNEVMHLLYSALRLPTTRSEEE